MINEKYEGTDKIIEVGDRVMYGGEVTEIVDINLYERLSNDYKLGNSVWLVTKGSLQYIGGKTPHKHRDLIIAWANGVEIEYLTVDGTWDSMFSPIWNPLWEYRIKPSKSPKQLHKERIQKEMEKLAKDLEALDI